MKNIVAVYGAVLSVSLACASHTPASDKATSSNRKSDDASSQPKTTTADEGPSATGSYEVSLSYTKGTNISPAIVYAIWLEDRKGEFLYPIYICKRLLNDSLTGTALPYWWMNKRPKMDEGLIDAVTGATVKSSDFEVSAKITNPPSSELTIYVEMDHSFDSNDWFSDQPAIVWSSNFDLNKRPLSSELTPIGWTPAKTLKSIPDAEGGKLHQEMRYITNHKDGSGFGGVDERSAVNMVGSLRVSVE